MKCKQPDCDRDAYAREWCRMHYERWRAHGDPTINKNDKGGIRGHFMYGAWNQMINRCHNPRNSSYGRYGARGVRVCERWRDDFRNFLADMGERPEGMTLDRIDPYGDYEPSNCRWATMKQQRANRTSDGDKRMRDAARKAKKAYWLERRDDLSTRDEIVLARLSVMSVTGFVRAAELGVTHERERWSLRKLVKRGYAEKIMSGTYGPGAAGYRISQDGADYLQKAARALE